MIIQLMVCHTMFSMRTPMYDCNFGKPKFFIHVSKGCGPGWPGNAVLDNVTNRMFNLELAN